MTHKSGRSAFQYALNRVQALSTKHSEQAEIISLGATAWAYGITPEMMKVFGRIASSLRVTEEDIRQLECHGIENRAMPKPRTVTYEVTLDTGPFEEALKRYVEDCGPKPRKPWLDAKDGEIWEIFMPGEAILCRADDDGDFTPVFGHHYYATIANGSNKIGNARKIWPETGDDK